MTMHAFIATIRIDEDADFTRRFPDGYNYYVEVTTTSGQRFAAATDYAKGHWRHPLSDAEVEHQIRGLAGGMLAEPQCHTTLACLWSLQPSPNRQALVDGLVVTQG
jgi:2-methylcitrate dehydratase PrpD